jgi:hypothetical protein
MNTVGEMRAMALALRTAFILGKWEGDPSKVSLKEIGQIDLSVINEVRDES